MSADAVTLSRRSFLGGALVLAAATAVPAHALKALGPLPVIYGDGIHDDTAGLQAAIDGKPFRVFGDRAYAVRTGGRVFIGQGRFRLSDTLRLNGPVSVTISDAHMVWDELPDGQPCISVTGSAQHLIEHSVLVTSGIRTCVPTSA